MVAALFTVNLGISIPLASFGVFLPIIAETFGWSRGAISTALSINLLLGGLAGFALGALADRHGPRLVLIVTVALAGTAFALVSTVDALWQLYLFVGVLGGIGMSSFYLLAATTVAHWYDEGRGLALALALIGFNLGYLVAGPLAASLIATVGWRGAYACLGKLRAGRAARRRDGAVAASRRWRPFSPPPRTRARRPARAGRDSRCARPWPIRGNGV